MNDSPVPHADALLAHAGFVRCMARAALQGDREVEDVVQDTWLAALQSAPRKKTALRAWLGGIARRQAANRVRREVAARRRDRAAGSVGEVDSAADMAARVELGRALIEAVLALEEPYRQAVLLRFYEDLPPRVIAQQLGMPVETVRTHVKRGLKQLRLRLKQSYRDEPGGSAAALMIILEPPSRVLPPLLGALGGVLMAKKTLATVAVLALLIGCGVWSGVIPWNTEVHDNAPALEGAGAPESATPTLVSRVVPDVAAPPDAPDPAAPATGLAGIVVEKGTNKPLANVPVYAGRTDRAGRTRMARSDAEGRFNFGDVEPGVMSIFVLGAGWVSDRAWEASGRGFDPNVHTVPLAPNQTLTLAAVPCAVVRGVVLAADGSPVVGAAVIASPDGTDIRPRRPINPRVVLTDASGGFRHDALMPHKRCWFAVRTAAHPGTAGSTFLLRPGNDNPRVTFTLPAGRHLGVQVLDTQRGTGVAGVEVSAGWDDEHAGRWIVRTAHTGADGRADLGAVPHSRVRIDLEQGGYLQPPAPLWVVAGVEDVQVEVPLDPGVSVRGRVTVPPGLDITRARVNAEPRSGGNRGSAEFAVAADGTFEITGIAAGAYRIHATLYRAPEWFVGTANVTAPGFGNVVELHLNNGPFPDAPGSEKYDLTTAALRVVGPSGDPVRKGWIRFYDEAVGDAVDLEEGPARIRVRSDGEGVRFECNDLGLDTDGRHLAAGTYGPIQPVGGVLTLRLQAGSSIAGRVSLADGAAAAGVRITAYDVNRPGTHHDDAGEAMGEAHTDAEGHFTLPGLRAAAYFLKLDVPASQVVPGPIRVTPGGSELAIRLEASQTTTVRVVDESGRPVEGAAVSIEPREILHAAFSDTIHAAQTDKLGRATLQRLVRGETYELMVRPPRRDDQTLLVHSDPAWRAGRTVVHLERGLLTTGVVQDADGKRLPHAYIHYCENDDPETGTLMCDAQGRFRIGPLRAGTLYFVARPQGASTKGRMVPGPDNQPGVAVGTRDLVLTVGD